MYTSQGRPATSSNQLSYGAIRPRNYNDMVPQQTLTWTGKGFKSSMSPAPMMGGGGGAPAPAQSDLSKLLSSVSGMGMAMPKLPSLGAVPQFAPQGDGPHNKWGGYGNYADYMKYGPGGGGGGGASGGHYANPGIDVGGVYDDLQRQRAVMNQSRAIPAPQDNSLAGLLGRAYQAQGGTMLNSTIDAANAQQRLASGTAADQAGAQGMDLYAQLYGLNSQMGQINRNFPVQWFGAASRGI